MAVGWGHPPQPTPCLRPSVHCRVPLQAGTSSSISEQGGVAEVNPSPAALQLCSVFTVFMQNHSFLLLLLLVGPGRVPGVSSAPGAADDVRGQEAANSRALPIKSHGRSARGRRRPAALWGGGENARHVPPTTPPVSHWGEGRAPRDVAVPCPEPPRVGCGVPPGHPHTGMGALRGGCTAGPPLGVSPGWAVGDGRSHGVAPSDTFCVTEHPTGTRLWDPKPGEGDAGRGMERERGTVMVGVDRRRWGW